MNNRQLIERLGSEKELTHAQWAALLSTFSEDDRLFAAALASEITRKRFGRQIFFRGIIEFSNICRNDCLYCGIRRSNPHVTRYCLSREDILLCCEEGYRMGYRTFVLQSGEGGPKREEWLLEVIRRIRECFPDCAITLSVGECSRESYEAMFAAGADRYLLRHETADAQHYSRLHPPGMTLESRLRCLRDLREIGFQVGCGMMVGSPFQTVDTLAKDMALMREFSPQMVGIGPFLPHADTPFADSAPGSQRLTLLLLSLTRIMLPDVLLPATTALGTAAEDGRIQGVLAGCNVVMPNLSPRSVRKDYLLYDNKQGTELSARESLELLRRQMRSIGREVVVGRGDHKDFERKK